MADALAVIMSEFSAYDADKVLRLPFLAFVELVKMAAFSKRLKFEPVRQILQAFAGNAKQKGVQLTSYGLIPAGIGKG